MCFLKKVLDLIFKYNFMLGFFVGAFSATIFAPSYHIGFVFTFSIFLYQIIRAKSMKESVMFALGFGFSHFAMSLFWISNAYEMVNDTDLNMLSVFVPFFFGFWGASFFIVCAIFTYKLNGNYLKWLGFAGIFGLMEWVRSWLFTGFPWNALSTSLSFDDNIIQITSIIGTYGLSIFLVLFASSLALLPKIKPVIISGIIILTFYGFGYFRLEHNPTYYVENSPKIRVVQASIPMKEKNKNREMALHEYVNLSRKNDKKKEITHVLWPESAYPYFLDDDSSFYHSFLIRAMNKDGTLLVGGDRREFMGDGKIRLFNSLVAIDDIGETFITYDKSHLVPFGEYVPLKKYMPKMVKKIADGFIDFSSGSGIKTYDLYKAPPFSPLICFEVIFSGRVVDKGYRPAWFISISNDAWYGKSDGPYQHLVNAKLRSVEEGIPMFRASSSGISAVIDAYGRILKKIGLDEKGYIDSEIPVATLSPTFFGDYGNIIPVFLSIALIFITLAIHFYYISVANNK